MVQDEKSFLISEIKRLSNFLDKQYENELKFRDHCYLRIAYDNTIEDKWDNKVAKPFVKFATILQLEIVIEKLNNYNSDKLILLSDNEKSLKYRPNYKNKNDSELTLF